MDRDDGSMRMCGKEKRERAKAKERDKADESKQVRAKCEKTGENAERDRKQ